MKRRGQIDVAVVGGGVVGAACALVVIQAARLRPTTRSGEAVARPAKISPRASHRPGASACRLMPSSSK